MSLRGTVSQTTTTTTTTQNVGFGINLQSQPNHLPLTLPYTEPQFPQLQGDNIPNSGHVNILNRCNCLIPEFQPWLCHDLGV